MKSYTGLSTGLLAVQVAAQNSTLESQCASLVSSLSIPNGTVNLSEVVRAGSTVSFPGVDSSCGAPSQQVSSDICRVTANVTTSATSGLYMEAWLPLNWTGRFLSTGNGGMGGCIQYADMDYASSLGFATVGTNNGHNGQTGKFFYQNPGVTEDYVYRAMHTGVVVGKSISETFYSKTHTKSYYLGCSTGGRQGMKEVQDFPDDFDGVVAGAPAVNLNNLNTWSAHFLPITGSPTSDTFVTQAQWGNVVHPDILNQCDALDGLVDGILESPMMCNYTVSSNITCTDASTDKSTCLTEKQANTVNQIFSPVISPNGTLLYPRMQPGSELNEAFAFSYSGEPSFITDWLQYAVLQDPNWNASSFGPADYLVAQTANPFNAATWKGDLSAFQKRGGKLLHYHGQADGVISSDTSPLYREHVSARMGLSNDKLDDFYRFFRVSGMAHCRGGIGAHFIGNNDENLGASYEPEENVLMAMVRWVEEGVAPETITGTAFVNNTAGNAVDYKRKHCRWPLRNFFNGTGDAKNPDSWSCIPDPTQAAVAASAVKVWAFPQ